MDWGSLASGILSGYSAVENINNNKERLQMAKSREDRISKAEKIRIDDDLAEKKRQQEVAALHAALIEVQDGRVPNLDFINEGLAPEIQADNKSPTKIKGLVPVPDTGGDKFMIELDVGGESKPLTEDRSTNKDDPVRVVSKNDLVNELHGAYQVKAMIYDPRFKTDPEFRKGVISRLEAMAARKGDRSMFASRKERERIEDNRQYEEKISSRNRGWKVEDDNRSHKQAMSRLYSQSALADKRYERQRQDLLEDRNNQRGQFLQDRQWNREQQQYDNALNRNQSTAERNLSLKMNPVEVDGQYYNRTASGGYEPHIGPDGAPMTARGGLTHQQKLQKAEALAKSSDGLLTIPDAYRQVDEAYSMPDPDIQRQQDAAQEKFNQDYEVIQQAKANGEDTAAAVAEMQTYYPEADLTELMPDQPQNMSPAGYNSPMQQGISQRSNSASPREDGYEFEEQIESPDDVSNVFDEYKQYWSKMLRGRGSSPARTEAKKQLEQFGNSYGQYLTPEQQQELSALIGR